MAQKYGTSGILLCLYSRKMAKMFDAFYGMTNTRFSRDVPTYKLYDFPMMQEVLGRLKYTAERQLFAVLTGDCGTGKTKLFEGLWIVMIMGTFKCCIYLIQN
jgi:type II secretory pathway predicted ATPase ExeA